MSKLSWRCVLLHNHLCVQKPQRRPMLRRTTEESLSQDLHGCWPGFKERETKRETNRDLWTFIIKTACQNAWRHLIERLKKKERRYWRTERDSERRRSEIMGQPGLMLTSGNLGMWGLQNGSLDHFLLSANHRHLLVLSRNRTFIICYLNVT